MSYLPGQNYVQNPAGTWVPVSLATSGASMPVLLRDTNGLAQGVRADGYANVRVDPSTLMFDTFETVDTVNTWALGGTVIPTQTSAGVVSASAGTAAGANSRAESQPRFTPGSSAFLQYASIIQIEAATVTGSTRWWGLAVPNTTPTTTTPITNGSIFEVEAATGAMFGRTYSGGALTNSVAITRPTDGGYHRYQILYRASRVYFNIDNVDVGSIPFPNPAIAALPASMGTVNGGAALGAAPVLNISLVGVADTGKNFVQISDGKYPWREVQVTDPATIAGAGVPSLTTRTDQTWGPAINVNTNAIQKATYRLNVKPVARAQTAADVFLPMVTIHHPATSTRTLRLRKVTISGSSTAIAGYSIGEVHRIGAAPTGTALAAGSTGGAAARGTAGTGSYVPADPRDANGDATVMINGTTALAATSTGLLASGLVAYSATAAVHGGTAVIYDWAASEERKPLTIPSGVLGGFAIGMSTAGLHVWTVTIEISFTEE